jgi:DNA-binding PadR family transcriptional regulator
MIDTQFEKWKSRWVNAVLEVFIVSSVDIQPRYGGELVILSRKIVDPSIRVSTVYMILKRLADTGILLESKRTEVEGVTRGKMRVYYEITPNGLRYKQLIFNQVKSYNIPNRFENIKQTEMVK